jgi:hypothetical protein
MPLTRPQAVLECRARRRAATIATPRSLKRLELARNQPAGDARSALAARIAANASATSRRASRWRRSQVYASDFDAAFDQLLEVVLRDKPPDGARRPRAARRVVRRLPRCRGRQPRAPLTWACT